MGNVGCRVDVVNPRSNKTLISKKIKIIRVIGYIKVWKSLNNALEVAYMVTIFGYSAQRVM